MNREDKRQLAADLLDGYPSGPSAPKRATAIALAKAEQARAIILVEGVSDQRAVETLAIRRGRNLEIERVVVLPAGGVHAMGRLLARFGPSGRNLKLAGLCDAAEEPSLWADLTLSGVGSPDSRDGLERLGFFVCVDDLEDELIRAAGADRVLALFESQGDHASFRTLQNQPAWRGRPIESQLRRYLGSGARRKLRYAGLLVGSIELVAIPRPLDAALGAV